ncbi:hypothetical protein [Aureispira sp. CCB-QB1]|uniref:hypothetical protein n=1 Tax=Aureispira sp. CCB-QB1 TaxID=1313421 RepID=UPI0006983A6F|nr:hypothetical protein [Aureispira sp. CCB-QB1]
MQKNFFIIAVTFLAMTLLISCYETEVLSTKETVEVKETISSFRNTEEVATSSLDFQVGETYEFRSLSDDGNQTHKLSLTLGENGNLTVMQSNVAVESGDVSNSEVLAEGTVLSEGEQKSFTGATGYWVIPFDGGEPSFHATNGTIIFVINCDCTHVEGHSPSTSDCKAVANSSPKGGYVVTCNNVGCKKCDFNRSSVVSGDVLIVSHPSINSLSVH